ncbi:MAG: enoyl-CoA hydratase [Alphaproteobacteria bacterium]|nr:enoyl-CoA hydratase [Alphaproteobacteria bacterium]
MTVVTDDTMLVERRGAIGLLTFNNPARHNAVSLAMWRAGERLLGELEADPDVRVIMLRGAGGKAFVSGADISKFEEERASARAVVDYDAATNRMFDRLAACAKPTIAMIQGYCLGGGLALAVCCDLRFCSDDSVFGIPAARLGVAYPASGLRRLVALVGPAFAKEIMFTGARFDAAAARGMGLVNRVLSTDALATTVFGIAEGIAANAPLSVTAAKRIIGELLKDPDQRDAAACEAAIRACFESADYIEGRRAFVERRPPRFHGR